MIDDQAYTDDELFEEVENFVREYNGSIKCINRSEYMFSIEVADGLQEVVGRGVAEIVEKYRVNRAKYLIKNPLERINMIRKDFVGKGII